MTCNHDPIWVSESNVLFLRKWRRHAGHYDHELQEASSQDDMEDEGSEGSLVHQPTTAYNFSQDIYSNPASQPTSDPVSGDHSSGSHLDPPSSPGTHLPQQYPDPDPWYPFRSRVHCQLVLLLLGSHRKNTDLVTFQAFMSVLKVECVKFIVLHTNTFLL